MLTRSTNRARRRRRIRAKVSGTADRPRLSVFRSARYIYAALVDDAAGRTLTAASDLKSGAQAGKTKPGEFVKVNRARAVGQALAAAARERQIKRVVFDRGGYLFTGRIKAVADGARAGGLEF